MSLRAKVSLTLITRFTELMPLPSVMEVTATPAAGAGAVVVGVGVEGEAAGLLGGARLRPHRLQVLALVGRHAGAFEPAHGRVLGHVPGEHGGAAAMQAADEHEPVGRLGAGHSLTGSAAGLPRPGSATLGSLSRSGCSMLYPKRPTARS